MNDRKRFEKGLRTYASKNKHDFDVASFESETSEIKNIFDTSIESRYSSPVRESMNRTYKTSTKSNESKKSVKSNNATKIEHKRTRDTSKDKKSMLVKSRTSKKIQKHSNDELFDSDVDVNIDIDLEAEVERESVISVSPFKKSDCESVSDTDRDSRNDHHKQRSDLQRTNIGAFDIVLGPKKKTVKTDDSPYNSDDEDDEVRSSREKFIKHMDNIVEQIKKMRWGDTITVCANPNLTTTGGDGQRMCAITKIVRYKSFMFYGNGSKNILRYFMNKTKNDPDYSFQKIVQILNEKSHRRFMPVRSWEDLWKAYADEPIKYRYLFELIRSDQPCKPYLDIEWVDDDNDPRKTDYTEFVDKLRYDLIHIFKHRYNIDIDLTSILISTSHSQSKASFHVVIDKKIGKKTIAYRTNRKGMPESAWDLWLALIERDDSYEELLDGAVYTTDREFRVIYSNKTTEFRPLIPYKPNGKNPRETSLVTMKMNDCLRYVVTYSPDNEYYHIVTPEVPKKYAGLGRQYYDPNTFIPQTFTDKKINHLLMLARKVHPTAEYTGLSNSGGWRFSYRDKMEQCYTGNYHESNGFYIFENKEKGITYMKCMSEQCNGTKILEKPRTTQTITKRLF